MPQIGKIFKTLLRKKRNSRLCTTYDLGNDLDFNVPFHLRNIKRDAQSIKLDGCLKEEVKKR